MLVEKSELWVYKGRSPSPMLFARPTAKKRGSNINGDSTSDINKPESRLSESSSAQVISCQIRFLSRILLGDHQLSSIGQKSLGYVIKQFSILMLKCLENLPLFSLRSK